MSYSANPTEKQAPLMLDEALRYAERGWPIFPCRPDKRPLTANGFKDASTDAAIIESWWKQWPDALIAAPTGEAIGAWVLDIDDAAAFHSLASDFAIPATRSSRTGRGMHLYFAWDANEPVRNRLKCDELPGADIRGEGGYVILPPSLHPSGKRYEWERDEDASEAPSELVAIARREPSSGNSKTRELYLVENPAFAPVAVEALNLPPMSDAARLAKVATPVGERSEAVFAFVAQAVREGWQDADIGGVLLHAENAIAERVLGLGDPYREITRAISAARSDEQIAEGEIPHIREIASVDFSALIANGIAKARAKVANDNGAQLSGGAVPFSFVRVSDLRHREPQWLVDGLLEESSLALLFGDPGCYKSFLAIDLVSSVATGFPFHDRETRQGSVFYIAGEGHNGLKRRFSAWEKGNGVSLEGQPLFVSERAANLYDAESARAVADAIDRLAAQNGTPRLIVIDTVARSFGDGDENSTKDMNAFVAAMDNLKARYREATILLVHHTGHAEKGRARGSMALKGALDAEYKVTKTGEAIRLESSKMKEAAMPAPIGFQTVEVTLGHDRNGEPYGSIYLIENGSIIGRLATGKPLTGNAALGLQTARDVAERLGRDLSDGIPKDEWRAAFYEAFGTGSKRSAYHRALEKLCEVVPDGPADLCFLRDGLRLASDPKGEA